MNVKKDFVALAEYISANTSTPFEWGKFDCCLAVADALRAMTGHDFAESFRGHYASKRGAAMALRRYGQGTIKDTLNHIFGPFKPRLNTGRGDVVLVHTDIGDALGVCFGGQIWCAAENGLQPLPMRRAICCWSVSCQ
ncbi:DUF6950 family protein [Alteromonas confluentis]|uniref:DUF6950 domain-containing protein n=1 Tax=Alteromonas confluentis TaxID=1656094 RepID=A0A1E7ZEE4_9ALTE|nr:hypothetical protein [Alteromonas confluentis]OFC71822.1 hypothetical protein BFC18_06615 [Alteromonas confluentis]